MRLVTVRVDGGTRAGRVDGEAVTLLDAPDVGALLAADSVDVARSAAGAQRALAEVDLGPVVPRPPKVVCLGLNYRDHAAETSAPLPTHPVLFAKYARALTGPRDELPLPTDQVDWEVELAVIIGRPARHVSEARALDHVAGCAVVNDVSVRDWQFRTGQSLQGKTFERLTPLGPALVTPDEADVADAELGCEVDGEVRQRGITADMIFPPVACIAYLSRILTLEPGDVIATGTPAGVGIGRSPPVYLRAGQTVRAWVAGIGKLVNACVDGAA